MAELRADVVVLGAGPGGYTAAFRAADLGRRVVLVEKYAALGGVCLNVGCIPSKALLHVAEVLAAARDLAESGVEFGAPKLDLAKLRARKDAVVAQLSGGLAKLAAQRGVTVVTGTGTFAGPQRLDVATADGAVAIELRARDHRRRLARRAAARASRTTRACSTRPRRSRSKTCRGACWWSAAASSGSSSRPSTRRSAPR